MSVMFIRKRECAQSGTVLLFFGKLAPRWLGNSGRCGFEFGRCAAITLLAFNLFTRGRFLFAFQKLCGIEQRAAERSVETRPSAGGRGIPLKVRAHAFHF